MLERLIQFVERAEIQGRCCRLLVEDKGVAMCARILTGTRGHKLGESFALGGITTGARNVDDEPVNPFSDGGCGAGWRVGIWVSKKVSKVTDNLIRLHL